MKRLLAFACALLLILAGCQSGSQSEEGGGSQTDSSRTSAFGTGAPALPPPDSVDVGTIPPDSATRARFKAAMAYARQHSLSERPIGEIVQALGTQFLGRPYLYGPLDQTVDQTPAEQLVCRLDGFDCFTFDEAMLAMANTVKEGRFLYDAYKRHTRERRYRNGKIGYCNRLHYYTEFVKRAEKAGELRNITKQLGGKKLNTNYAFMGDHRSEYPQLKSDSLYQCIQDVEDRLNRTMTNYYIPQDSIRAIYGKLKAGDLLAFATDIKGLDVTHTGMVYKGQRDTTGLMHASTTGAVKISPDLQKYVQGVDSQIGIIVARPQG